MGKWLVEIKMSVCFEQIYWTNTRSCNFTSLLMDASNGHDGKNSNFFMFTLYSTGNRNGFFRGKKHKVGFILHFHHYQWYHFTRHKLTWMIFFRDNFPRNSQGLFVKSFHRFSIQRTKCESRKLSWEERKKPGENNETSHKHKLLCI